MEQRAGNAAEQSVIGQKNPCGRGEYADSGMHALKTGYGFGSTLLSYAEESGMKVPYHLDEVVAGGEQALGLADHVCNDTQVTDNPYRQGAGAAIKTGGDFLAGSVGISDGAIPQLSAAAEKSGLVQQGTGLSLATKAGQDLAPSKHITGPVGAFAEWATAETEGGQQQAYTHRLDGSHGPVIAAISAGATALGAHENDPGMAGNAGASGDLGMYNATGNAAADHFYEWWHSDYSDGGGRRVAVESEYETGLEKYQRAKKLAEMDGPMSAAAQWYVDEHAKTYGPKSAPAAAGSQALDADGDLLIED